MDNQHQNGIFSDYSLEQTRTHSVSKSFFANVFLWMFGALAISAVFAFLFSSNNHLMAYLYQNYKLTGIGKIVLFAPIGFVLLMSFGFQRLSAPLMAAL